MTNEKLDIITGYKNVGLVGINNKKNNFIKFYAIILRFFFSNFKLLRALPLFSSKTTRI